MEACELIVITAFENSKVKFSIWVLPGTN